MTHIMVDLETWGCVPGSDIRSIGAVVFDPVAGTLGEEFYVNVIGGGKHGLTHDPDTVNWWSKQSEEAQQRLLVDRVSLMEGLSKFSQWVYDVAPHEHGHPVGGWPCPEIRLWAHGPHFDEAILAACHRATGQTIPWHYRAPRDCRTIWEAVGGVEVSFEGVQHDALADAKHQARCVIEAYRKLRDPSGLLAESGELFRTYESHHRAKISEAGRPEKAERNADIAGRIETFLTGAAA